MSTDHRAVACGRRRGQAASTPCSGRVARRRARGPKLWAVAMAGPWLWYGAGRACNLRARGEEIPTCRADRGAKRSKLLLGAFWGRVVGAAIRLETSREGGEARMLEPTSYLHRATEVSVAPRTMPRAGVVVSRRALAAAALLSLVLGLALSQAL